MPGDYEEHDGELLRLAEEWDLGKDTTKIIEEREKIIRARILELADKVNATQRVEMIVPDIERKWDRQLSKKVGTGEVSLDRLENLLGLKTYKQLCCVRRVSYYFDMEVFSKSREDGHITDAHLAECEVPVEYTPRLQLAKLNREELAALNGEPDVWV